MGAPRRLLISFSGGETSALMTKLIYERWQDRYDEIKTIFANTGEENEETLRFVQRCDEEWGWGVIWIEAVTPPERGIGARARAVDFRSASRQGEPFEEMIRKHGIPNKVTPHCTRELKARPIKAYLRENDWPTGSYDTAIGIRIDEIDRMDRNWKANRIVYPMGEWRLRKIDVNEFWGRQPFRLDLAGYQGNCKWCWKKSLRKHLTIMKEAPEAFAFPERMEREYPLAGTNPNGEPRVFFRDGRSTGDLRRLAATTRFMPASDDAREYQTDIFSFLALDLGGDCEESCEVRFDDAA